MLRCSRQRVSDRHRLVPLHANRSSRGPVQQGRSPARIRQLCAIFFSEWVNVFRLGRGVHRCACPSFRQAAQAGDVPLTLFEWLTECPFGHHRPARV
jgi:hypothetical protein